MLFRLVLFAALWHAAFCVGQDGEESKEKDPDWVQLTFGINQRRWGQLEIQSNRQKAIVRMQMNKPSDTNNVNCDTTPGRRKLDRKNLKICKLKVECYEKGFENTLLCTAMKQSTRTNVLKSCGWSEKELNNAGIRECDTNFEPTNEQREDLIISVENPTEQTVVKELTLLVPPQELDPCDEQTDNTAPTGPFHFVKDSSDTAHPSNIDCNRLPTAELESKRYWSKICGLMVQCRDQDNFDDYIWVTCQALFNRPPYYLGGCRQPLPTDVEMCNLNTI